MKNNPLGTYNTKLEFKKIVKKRTSSTMVCSNCGSSDHYRTTCPRLCLVDVGQAKRGAAARDRETSGHAANEYGSGARRDASAMVHAKPGQSIARDYRTGDVRR